MHLIDRAGARAAVFAVAAMLGIACGVVPVRAAAPGLTGETRGAFHAVSFAPLPEESRIEVRLMDDSPQNVDLARRIQEELRRRGYAEPEGARLVLTVETEVSVLTESRDGESGTAAAEDDEDPIVIGFLRAALDDPRSGERLWAAEAAFRRSDGDLQAGAKSLAPLLVDTIGRSTELEDITIR